MKHENGKRGRRENGGREKTKQSNLNCINLWPTIECTEWASECYEIVHTL